MQGGGVEAFLARNGHTAALAPVWIVMLASIHTDHITERYPS
jgi:hypothetical protein